ncbi:MAG: NAD-dependent malic enzyme, partial [Halioglobus sp.]|nr:NAD-dependent malic enzyme [Halioglobus sp.]
MDIKDSEYRGVRLLHDPLRNKGTAFTAAERAALGLRGLLPARAHSMAEQERRVLGNIRSKATDLEKYLFLIALQDRNETLFYRVLMNNIEEMMPLVYTPTVGAACQAFGHIYRRPRGMYLSIDDRGHVGDILRNWPHDEVRVIVVTDGERILGLGDLGANGMGIPVGKLSLYTACAGIAPQYCLPVMLDVGTNNEQLLDDELYIGLERLRERGDAYDELIAEFITAAQERFPGVLVQLEDFGNANAFRLLWSLRERHCVFDDDIQGTGAVTLAGIMSALRLTGTPLQEQRLLFFGAGQANVGAADMVVAALREAGLAEQAAREVCWFFDSTGLLVSSRTSLPAQKQPYARDHAPITDLAQAVDALRPTALIGASGQPGTFTEEVVRAMARYNEQPIIFALSNPTAKAECTAEQCYGWTEGRGIFASGSPFAPVEYEGRRFVPGQGNNAYIFPGVGLGVIASGARRVTDDMFLAAAHCLSGRVGAEQLATGQLFPPLSDIRQVCTAIAVEVAGLAWEHDLASRERPADIAAAIEAMLYDP